jgi:hypothetical protein
MRNADEVARKIAKAVMDRIEFDRAVHQSSIEEEVRRGLESVTVTLVHDPASLMREQHVLAVREVRLPAGALPQMDD